MSISPRAAPICLALWLLTSATWAGAVERAPNGAPTHIGSAKEPERAFLAGNDVAMAKMMKGMTIKPSGDVDRDFVDMMTPHHQGAIDMAILVLRYGHNEKIRRLAQEIIVDQQQEIAAMRRAVGEPLPPSAPAPTTTPQPKGSAQGMKMK